MRGLFIRPPFLIMIISPNSFSFLRISSWSEGLDIKAEFAVAASYAFIIGS